MTVLPPWLDRLLSPAERRAVVDLAEGILEGFAGPCREWRVEGLDLVGLCERGRVRVEEGLVEALHAAMEHLGETPGLREALRLAYRLRHSTRVTAGARVRGKGHGRPGGAVGEEVRG